MSVRQKILAVIAVTDSAALVLAVTAASLIRSLVGIAPFNLSDHLIAAALILPTQLLVFRLVGLYDLERVLAGTYEYGRVGLAATYTLFLVVGISFFVGGVPLVSRSWLLLVWGFTVFGVVIARFGARRVVRHARRRGKLHTRVIVVGASASGMSVARDIAAIKDEGAEFAGFLDEYAPLGRELLPGLRVIGRPADLVRNPGAFPADQYVLVVEALPHQRLDELTRALLPLQGVSVRLTVGPLGLMARQTFAAQRSGIPLIALRRAEIAGFEAVTKRLFDVVVGSAALAVVGLFALFAAVIALVRGRRHLVRAQRVYGPGGATVRLPLLSHDVSRFLPLRGAPALLSVLAGRLSIVGPRPVLRDGTLPPLSLQLSTVKPGLTGPWRLSGAAASLEDQARDDLMYIRSYTLWEDLRIVLETLRRLGPQRTTADIARWQVPEFGTSRMLETHRRGAA